MKLNKAFWKWFGKSQVVDEEGVPLVLYHGTTKAIKKFEKALIKSRFPFSFGFHFTDRPAEADIYAGGFEMSQPKSKKFDEGAVVYPVYLKSENPLIYKTKDLTASVFIDRNRDEIVSKLAESSYSKNQYDSVIVIRDRGDDYDGINVVVFDPRQIKSAIGNDGTYDADDPDIRSNPDLDWVKTKTYKTPHGSFEEYFLGGDGRSGIMTIETDKRKGFRVRNVFVDKPIQRMGYASRGYVLANEESMRRSNKPLRSSEIGYEKKNSVTSMSPDAVALWDYFVGAGLARRVGDHYEFWS